MLSVLLLLSKYRLRNVPVIERGSPYLKNFITQSAVVRGLVGCKGRDWFDCISAHPISELGLPYMSADEVCHLLHLNTMYFLILIIQKLVTGSLVFQCVCQVISVRDDELILEAFKKMRDNNIGGLPVVEGSKKKIVGNVSIRDIRFLLLKPELFSNFRYVFI